METKELIKAALLFLLYLGAAPALGMVIARSQTLVRICFGLMCFMTISGFFTAGEWGLSLGSELEYRGHARGYHFYFNEVLAIALILARAVECRGKRTFRLFGPGLWIYLLHATLCLVSIINAPVAHYVFMAAFKAFKVVLIFIAAFNFFQQEKDLRVFLHTMSATMLWECLVVLKHKYLDGFYQIIGTFEHQNALSMYGTLIGMVLLAAAAGPRRPASWFWFMGYLASAVVVECTLSRAGLVVFGGASVGVMLLSLADRVTVRRVTIVCSLALMGLLGLAIAMDTIINRFNAHYNQDSNETRRLLNIASREMFHDHPLGIGWNNYALVINPPYRYGRVIDEHFIKLGEGIDKNHRKGIAESQYYLLLSETGWQGLSSYLLFVGLFLWWNLRAAWRFRGELLSAVSIGIATGCLANYLQSTLERVLTQPRNMMLWMILLALTSRVEWMRRRAARRPPRPAATRTVPETRAIETV